MNIVILTTKNHFYANIIINYLFEHFSDDIKLVIESEALLPNQSKLGSLKRYLKTAGLYYVSCQVVKQWLFNLFFFLSRLFNKKNSFYSFKNVFQKEKIKVWERFKNKEELITRIKKENPDLIISIFSKYILKNDILSIPKFALNIHPSYLPHYRGISPTFWVLANNETKTGVTVHKMDEEIDHGQLVVQKEFEIKKDDTEHSVYLKCCQNGKIILKNIIDSIIQEKFTLSYDSQEEGSYFSLPSKEAVYRFRKNKRKFFTLKEIISIF